MSAQHIEQLRLFNFRNYDEVVVALHPGLNVFCGDNAQGKTNLLEAVATLALAHSPRATNALDLIRWEEQEALVEADLLHPAKSHVSLRLSADPISHRVSRAIKTDGKPLPLRDMLGRCPVVIFWPDDLLLVKSGPELRRRLLDTALCQIDNRIALELLRYRRSLEQRNAVLRRLHDGTSQVSELQAFDASFAEHGARVREGRSRIVAALAPLAQAAMDEISGHVESLELDYILSGEASVVTDFGGLQRQIQDTLERSRTAEINRGVTLFGPHRDDVALRIGGKPARVAASQGQQRSIVLALKIAEVRHLEDVSGTAPVLLLDDVLSELDSHRREALQKMIINSHLQALVTTTDASLRVHGAQYFEVKAGRVKATAAALEE